MSTRYRELEGAIDAVFQSYSSGLAIDNLESAALPNKRCIIDGLDHVRRALFMGFYSTHGLSQENLRHGIAEHMYAAFRALAEQIERAISYAKKFHPGAQVPSESGEEIALGLFRALPELRRRLDGDVAAAYDGDPAAKSIEEIVFSYPSIDAIVSYRIAHVLHRAGVPMIPRIITEHAHSRTGIDISPGAQIGERFFIDHGTGVVIGETSVIHDRVKLYQGVTLGALSVRRRDEHGAKRHPTLEDDVTIYAGATVLGGNTVIGQGSVIGGNVWLTQSVPPGSRVFGKGRNEEEDR